MAFVGQTQFAKGRWFGVILDTPQGKNDGSVNGVVYFECEPRHGIFVKAEKLAIDHSSKSDKHCSNVSDGAAGCARKSGKDWYEFTDYEYVDSSKMSLKTIHSKLGREFV